MKQARHTSGSFFEPLEGRTMFAAGGIDFATRVNFNNVEAAAHDVVVQPDGKTVVVGTTTDGRFAVARLNVDHSVDTTFGPNHDGRAFARINGFNSDASAVALDAHGDIIVAGTARDGGDSYVGIVRFLPNGQYDPTFGGDALSSGFTMCDLDGEQRSRVSDVAVQNDGKIVVAGTGYNYHLFGPSTVDMLVGRFNPNGTLDESFGDDGHRFIGGEGGEDGKALAIDRSNGNIIVAGTTNNGLQEMAVGRLNSSGNFDGGFNGGQTKLIIANGHASDARGVTVLPGGKIAVVGSSNGQFATVRILSNGQLDNTFGRINPSNTALRLGWVVTTIGSSAHATDVIQNANGDLIVAGGSSDNGGDGAVVKYKSNGTLDTTFGQNGIAEVVFADRSGFARLAPGPGLRFVAVGGSLGFDVARYFDAGAKQVSITPIRTAASEAGPSTGAFLVQRSENLPFATRVYFTIGGTASSPSLVNFKFKTADYGMTHMQVDLLSGTRGFVDIPAGSFSTTVTLTPIDDTAKEATETATFTAATDPSYDIVGTPSVTISIADNDSFHITKLTSTTALTSGTSASLWSELPIN